jgi:hypothetical protein
LKYEEFIDKEFEVVTLNTRAEAAASMEATRSEPWAVNIDSEWYAFLDMTDIASAPVWLFFIDYVLEDSTLNDDLIPYWDDLIKAYPDNGI